MPKKLVSVSDKSINACVQVHLDPAAVSGSIDIEQFQKVIEINLQLENRLTELEVLQVHNIYPANVTFSSKVTLRRLEDLMLSKLTQSAHTQTESELSLSTVQDLNNKVDTKLSNYQQSLMEKIDDEFMTIGCDVKSNSEKPMRKYNDIKTRIATLERDVMKNTSHIIGMNHSHRSLESTRLENPMHECSEIKARIATLERDVMKNTSHIVGMNYSHRSLEWTRPQSFGSAGMFPSDNRCYGEPAAFAAASSYYDMPPMAKPGPTGPSGTVSPPSPPAPPAPSAFVPPPPPAPPSTSAFCQPLPPAPPAPLSQNTSKKSDSEKSSSSSTAKVEKVYGRIPITTEILKSVVLKPPGERKRVSKSVTI
ncbi:uncharacterized protein LOC111032656 [Myzus persicae]|uniref:uncharacterized protein LOC111032656 n=1 Tax=Myzus persicae TaxID=13164 RepID=UPI000B938BFC|nr:uncharacterized protein LOC111032656 [Myzus persicae]